MQMRRAGCKARLPPSCYSNRVRRCEDATCAKLLSTPLPSPFARGNLLSCSGWLAVADALEQVRCLTRLNWCGEYGAIRAGGMREMLLGETELGVWAARFLERSGSTLTRLHLRCQLQARKQ